MNNYFDFEKPIEEIDNKIKFLEQNEIKEIGVIEGYQKKKIKLFETIYTQLTPWQKVQVASPPYRPHSAAYIKNIFRFMLPTQFYWKEV